MQHQAIADTPRFFHRLIVKRGYNNGPEGPHIVHQSTMCRLC